MLFPFPPLSANALAGGHIVAWEPDRFVRCLEEGLAPRVGGEGESTRWSNKAIPAGVGRKFWSEGAVSAEPPVGFINF